jgi:hypothetical protein
LAHTLEKSAEEVVRDAYPTKVHALRLSEMQKFLAYNGVVFPPLAIKDSILPLAVALFDSGNFQIPPDGWRLDITYQTVAEGVSTPESVFEETQSEAAFKGSVESDISKFPILKLRKAIKEVPGFSWDETQGMKKVEILERYNGRDIAIGY